MLVTIAVLLAILWVGCLFARIIGTLVHLILVAAVVMFVFHFIQHRGLARPWKEPAPVRHSQLR
ncbi:MAG: hypothetical protein JWL59_4759 [Chthoniobacteraceae bacterium]|nr:hypothetical protein [Chthoniobacteraceae bacterium]